MARPVIGIDLGHGETAAFIRIGSRIFALRLDVAGSLKMITALAVIRGGEQEIVLLGNALCGYETLRKLAEADAQTILGADFRALMLEYTNVVHDANPCVAEHALYIPCDKKELPEDVCTALRQTVDACCPDGVHFTLEKGDYFSPLYQTFKAPPRTKNNGFCAVTWDSVCNDDGQYRRTMGDVMELFLKTLSQRLIDNNMQEWLDTESGGDVHIGVPALREWLEGDAIEQYANMAAEAMRDWIRQPDEAEETEAAGTVVIQTGKPASPLRRHVSIYSEPCAALMSCFREYPDCRLQQGCSVSDHGSGSLDYCCIAVKDGMLCRLTGSTDQCGGRMIEDGMLRQLTDRENLSILRDLRPGEGSALRLQLRLIKEAYYNDPAAIGDLPQRLRIHLKDGSVRVVVFTARELVRNVVQPGSRWNTTVSGFADNMVSAMVNQGLKSNSLFLTGGTANVVEVQEIFAAAGLGDVHMSHDTSAAVADGLCRMITSAELDEFWDDIVAVLSAQENEAAPAFITKLHTAFAAVLPSAVTTVAQRYLDQGKKTSLRHFTFEVERLLQHNAQLLPDIQSAISDYASAHEKQFRPVVAERAEARFPGRLPENPQLTINYGDIVASVEQKIVREFVSSLNLYGLLGNIVYGLMALFGKANKNPELYRAELERIKRNMGKSGISFDVRSAVTRALTKAEIYSEIDGLVLGVVIGYLTLTHFDVDLQL